MIVGEFKVFVAATIGEITRQKAAQLLGYARSTFYTWLEEVASQVREALEQPAE